MLELGHHLFGGVVEANFALYGADAAVREPDPGAGRPSAEGREQPRLADPPGEHGGAGAVVGRQREQGLEGAVGEVGGQQKALAQVRRAELHHGLVRRRRQSRDHPEAVAIVEAQLAGPLVQLRHVPDLTRYLGLDRRRTAAQGRKPACGVGQPAVFGEPGAAFQLESLTGVDTHADLARAAGLDDQGAADLQVPDLQARVSEDLAARRQSQLQHRRGRQDRHAFHGVIGEPGLQVQVQQGLPGPPVRLPAEAQQRMVAGGRGDRHAFWRRVGPEPRPGPGMAWQPPHRRRAIEEATAR